MNLLFKTLFTFGILCIFQNSLFAQFPEANGAECIQFSDCTDRRIFNIYDLNAAYDGDNNLIPLPGYPYMGMGGFNQFLLDLLAFTGGNGVLGTTFSLFHPGALCGADNSNIDEIQLYDIGIVMGSIVLGNNDVVLNFSQFGNCCCIPAPEGGRF